MSKFGIRVKKGAFSSYATVALPPLSNHTLGLLVGVVVLGLVGVTELCMALLFVALLFVALLFVALLFAKISSSLDE